MRWIFFSLVIVNLLTFAWGMVSTSNEPNVRATTQKTHNPYQDYPELKLLSEIQTGLVRRELTQDAAVVSSEQTGSVGYKGKPLCELVGPFESTEVADNFVERLAAIEVISGARDIELPAGPGYWVYIEPQPTRQEALRLLSELQAKRIDSYVIPKGELVNGISLGMFSQKALSDARIKEIKSLGLVPKVEEIERLYREVWVMLQPGEELKMSELSWERVMEGINMLERRQNYCLDVASQ